MSLMPGLRLQTLMFYQDQFLGDREIEYYSNILRNLILIIRFSSNFHY